MPVAMQDHVVYCVDHPPTADVASTDQVRGWLVCSRKIEALEARLASGEPCRVEHGAPRPDVAASFGPYPDAGGSGLRIDVPAGALAGGAGLALTVTLRGRLGLRRRHTLTLRPESNGVQTVKLRRGRPHYGFSPETLEDDLRKSLAARPGLTFRLDIINKCNLRCVMCRYSDPEIFQRPTKKLSLDDFRGQFAELAPYVRNVVLSCADEPLASNHFGDILSYLADEHPHLDVEFCTNATLMTARIRRLLIEKGVAHLMFSLDGVRKETLERIRVGAKFERIVANVLALRDLKRRTGARRPAFIFNFVMFDDNVHETPAFVALASRLGAELIDFRHVIPGVFDEPARMLASHPAKYNHFRARILQEAKRHRIDVLVPPAFVTSETFDPASLPEADLSEVDAIAPDPDPEGPPPTPRRWPRGFRARQSRGTAAETFAKTFCERPFSELLIADQELIRPCAWYQGHLGKVSAGQRLDQVFFGPEFRRLRRNMLEPDGDPGCRGCPLKADYLMSVTQRTGGRFAWLRRTTRLLD